MPFKDLREFLGRLEEKGELVRLKEEVSLDLEMAAILRKLTYSKGPVVIFERIKEGTLPAVGNVFGTWERVLEATEGVDPEERANALAELMKFRPPEGLLDAFKSLGELKKVASYFPKRTSKTAMKEEWREVDLFKLPALRQWPLEPGRFITMGATFVRRGDSVNYGYYRLQVVAKDKFLVHWMPWRRSEAYAAGREKVEVAVVFGMDPVTTLVGGVPVPPPLEKLFVAGVLRGEGVEVVQGRTVDLSYPANAELVIEGELTGETMPEGPYGDHAGVYSIVKNYPVVKVKAIYSRENPIIPVTTTGKPVLEDGQFILFGQKVVKPLLKTVLPEIVDFYMPPEGLSYVFIVSIRKRLPGHARKVMSAIWGLTPLVGKVLIVVDHDVNVRDLGQVMYAVSAHVDPQRDVLVIPNYPAEELDPSPSTPSLGSKLGIDATRKLPEEYGGKEYPRDLVAPEEIEKRADEILSRLARDKR
ncbi:MAG: UbiD family decarboxylase [Thermoprotei archaeon]